MKSMKNKIIICLFILFSINCYFYTKMVYRIGYTIGRQETAERYLCYMRAKVMDKSICDVINK